MWLCYVTVWVDLLLIYLQLLLAVCVVTAQAHFHYSTMPLCGAIAVRKLDRSRHASSFDSY